DEPAEAPEPVFTFRRRGVRYEDDEPDEVPGGPDDVFGEAPDDVFYEDDGEAADESGFVYHDDVRFDDD
ncbi:MAG: hypothetical protein IIY92_01470, partial [Lachnospiraceae bacterium]|nr:hypothetical protein [Lachnospiraceae bacterium]